MKLAASHIGWAPGDDEAALALLQKYGFAGLEVAPTRVAGPDPYEKPAEAAVFAGTMQEGYGLTICSLQSIWFGQAGNMFGAEREDLLDYSKGAIRFAKAAGAGNLVFGSPKNRVLPAGKSPDDALPFFKELGDYAAAHGTCLALEANAAAYGTNFMNHTDEALAMAEKVGSPGCRVNFDFGTLLLNGEDVAVLHGQVHRVNHVHISEPYLAMLEKRPQHRALAALLRAEGYVGYVSIEMKERPLDEVEQALAWVAEVFA